MIQPPKGFSLLEILVAFAIMAVALTIVLRIFGTGVNNAILSEEYTLAVQIAESLQARTGIEIPLEVGESSGDEGGKYHWLLKIIDVTPAPPPASTPANPNLPVAQPVPLYAVQVQVFWQDDGREMRSVDIRSLKMQ
ncbi:prepilin-type N-terminal cleavage/methylation domain-containing protein [Methylomonas paludis]|uniref:Prepilin-type N-terminal cleavage/methylation domain-containing protein n=1 Tax=Methylomonas paludis TaxID=1173101 RepID=A0A975R953_9GAMM|nr:prepilin-type N-terminal cleavage/methylation domain-containing protein [Methylomonas paludis]QWF69918.1 prepilin-type N-terminal cleavage/methylation domain-containing protein [Methylomonas paludis]